MMKAESTWALFDVDPVGQQVSVFVTAWLLFSSGSRLLVLGSRMQHRVAV